VSGSAWVCGERDTRSVGCWDVGAPGKGYSVEPAPASVDDITGWSLAVAAGATRWWKQLESVVSVCFDGGWSVSSVESSTSASPDKEDSELEGAFRKTLRRKPREREGETNDTLSMLIESPWQDPSSSSNVRHFCCWFLLPLLGV